MIVNWLIRHLLALDWPSQGQGFYMWSVAPVHSALWTWMHFYWISMKNITLLIPESHTYYSNSDSLWSLQMSFVFLRQEIPEVIILRGYLGWYYKYVIRSYIHFLIYEMCLNCLINPQNKNGQLGISQTFFYYYDKIQISFYKGKFISKAWMK